MGRKKGGALLGGLLTLFLCAPRAHASSSGGPAVKGDFDGNGFDDLAVGVPFDLVTDQQGGAVHSAGAVNVIYGAPAGVQQAGLATPNNQLFSQSPCGLSADEDGEEFGAALAVGDFDGNGFDDLAVGARRQAVVTSLGTQSNAGAVFVFYGSPQGLTCTGAQMFTQDVLAVPGEEAEAGDRFGSSLAAGNFDGTTFGGRHVDDLAIGVPDEDVKRLGVDRADAGSVNVIYGLAGFGLRVVNAQVWNQTTGLGGVAEAGDHFGFALAAANFDGNFRNGTPIDDLAVGVPGEERVAGADDAGAVQIVFGSEARLTAEDSQFWMQGTSDTFGSVEGDPDRGDLFGSALAAANFGLDPTSAQPADDLAIGVPGEESATGEARAGAVNVLYGLIGRGLTTSGNKLWSQDASDIFGSMPGATEQDDRFGFALAAGDWSGGGVDDLAIGVPGESKSANAPNPNAAKAGAVHVLYGSQSHGLRTLGTQVFRLEDISGAEANGGEQFGFAVATGDFDGSLGDDLVVAAPFESVPGQTIVSQGVAYVIYHDDRFARLGDRQEVWFQGQRDSLGILRGIAQLGDRFGLALP
jgi:FG-GAP repeat protein